jgi:membrane-associated PAP2 superfamily phosphatase
MVTNRAILITFFVLIVVVAFFGVNDSIDLAIQDYTFDFSSNSFLLDSSVQPYRFIFYDGAKRVLIALAVVLLLILLFFYKSSFVRNYKQGILIVIFSAILIPVVVGGLKKTTNMPCPKHEIRYGGHYPRTAVWECYADDFEYKNKRIKCWPAGHASGGFALMSFFFFFKKRRNKYIALGGAMVIAWSMGIYKMLIGDHFFSHTVITMILAWLIVLIIAKSVYRFSKL